MKSCRDGSLDMVALAYACSRMQERMRGIAGYHNEGIDKKGKPTQRKDDYMASAHVHAVLVFLLETSPVLWLVRTRTAASTLHAWTKTLW